MCVFPCHRRVMPAWPRRKSTKDELQSLARFLRDSCAPSCAVSCTVSCAANKAPLPTKYPAHRRSILALRGGGAAIGIAPSIDGKLNADAGAGAPNDPTLALRVAVTTEQQSKTIRQRLVLFQNDARAGV